MAVWTSSGAARKRQIEAIKTREAEADCVANYVKRPEDEDFQEQGPKQSLSGVKLDINAFTLNILKSFFTRVLRKFIY